MGDEGTEHPSILGQNRGVSQKSGALSGARPELSTDSTSDPAAGEPDPLAVALDRLRLALAGCEPADALSIIEHAQALAGLPPAKRQAILAMVKATQSP